MKEKKRNANKTVRSAVLLRTGKCRLYIINTYTHKMHKHDRGVVCARMQDEAILMNLLMKQNKMRCETTIKPSQFAAQMKQHESAKLIVEIKSLRSID